MGSFFLWIHDAIGQISDWCIFHSIVLCKGVRDISHKLTASKGVFRGGNFENSSTV